MLSDEQLIEQIRTELRSELSDLNPPADLLDRLRDPAENDGRSQRGSRERSPDRRDQRGWRARVRGLGAAVPVLAAVIVVAIVAAAAFTSLRPRHSSTAVAPAGAGIPTHNGKIAFISGWSLELANPDGSGLRHVAAVPHQCDVPAYSRGVGCFAWSSDGKQLAYLAGGAHKLTLYLVGVDGQHPRPLTACGDCLGVSWSPDGSQIAVGRYAAGQVNVWVANAKTGAMRQITDCHPHSATCPAGGPIGTSDPAGYRFQVQWSPNGQKIFFIRFGVPTAVEAGGGWYGPGSLGTVRPDGSDLTELQIPDPETAFWSPDGRELAVINRDQGVYIVDAAGTAREVAKLWDPAGIAWSPDGRELAIAATGGIYTIDADGKALSRVAGPSQGGIILRPSQYRVPGFLDGTASAWSPNDKELAYGSLNVGAFAAEVRTMNADGSDSRLIFKITRDLCCGSSVTPVPIWSPDGRQLAFSSIAGTYVANADGSHLHRIGQGSRGAFAWQPIPSTR